MCFIKNIIHRYILLIFLLNINNVLCFMLNIVFYIRNEIQTHYEIPNYRLKEKKHDLYFE